MKKLKVICSQHPKRDHLISEDKSYKFCGIYLHGLLEDKCGYDICDILNPEDFTWETVNTTYSDDEIVPYEHLKSFGKMACKVYSIKEPCTAFIWESTLGKDNIYGNARGLICLNSDIESLKYAEQKFNKKACCL